LLPLIFVAVLATTAQAAVDVRIDGVGFEGYVSNVLPTPVKVHIAATDPQRVELTLLVHSGAAFMPPRSLM